MTLAELAVEYREGAQLLVQRLTELKLLHQSASDPQERLLLEGRMDPLLTMLRQARGVARYCEHYYDRGYGSRGIYSI